MNIRFGCPGCGKRYEVDASRAGRSGRCKACGEMMTVPAAEEEVEGDEAGMYAMEDPPSDGPEPVPTAFVRSKNESADRPEKRRKKRSSDLLEQVAGEAEEVLARNRGLVKKSLITLAILAILLGIVAAALPNGTFIAGAAMTGLGLSLILAGYALGTYIAYTEDMLHAALFLTIPLYTGYYIVMNWDEMWRPFALMFVGGLAMTVGGMILESLPSTEEEAVPQVRFHGTPASNRVGLVLLTNLPGGQS